MSNFTMYVQLLLFSDIGIFVACKFCKDFSAFSHADACFAFLSCCASYCSCKYLPLTQSKTHFCQNMYICYSFGSFHW